MPNTATATWLGRSYQAIKTLERMGLLTDARRAYRRLVIKAFDEGFLISRRDKDGKPLHHAIRIHWLSPAGMKMHRIYEDYPG